jgi:AraC family transcriptional regulator
MGAQLAVSAGASRFRRLDVSIGRVTANRFPANLTLPVHSHPQATIAVILTGGFSGTYHDEERDCRSRSVIVEPAGAEHANRFGRDETSILTLSLDATRLGRSVEATAHRFRHDRDPFAELIARRAANELDRPDDVTPLAVEAAALELIARVTRTARQERRPAWLDEARAFVHDRYAESFTLADVAAAVGVEPDRMARLFRRAYGEPVADYLRRIRVDAAAQMLASSDVPISQVAADVGFTDQSHLNRCFIRYMGTTPGRYRTAQSASTVERKEE